LDCTYLRGADLVECDKGKSLSHHGGGEVLFGKDKGDQEAREEQLREKCVERVGRWVGGCEIEEDIVRREVVAVVDAGDVMEVGVDKERGPITAMSG
jgi:hypothetical protein